MSRPAPTAREQGQPEREDLRKHPPRTPEKHHHKRVTSHIQAASPVCIKTWALGVKVGLSEALAWGWDMNHHGNRWKHASSLLLLSSGVETIHGTWKRKSSCGRRLLVEVMLLLFYQILEILSPTENARLGTAAKISLKRYQTNVAGKKKEPTQMFKKEGSISRNGRKTWEIIHHLPKRSLQQSGGVTVVHLPGQETEEPGRELFHRLLTTRYLHRLIKLVLIITVVLVNSNVTVHSCLLTCGSWTGMGWRLIFKDYPNSNLIFFKNSKNKNCFTDWSF